MSGFETGRVCPAHSGVVEGIRNLSDQVEGVRCDVRAVRNLLIGFLSSVALAAIGIAGAVLHGCVQ